MAVTLGQGEIGLDKPICTISVASEILATHPRALRPRPDPNPSIRPVEVVQTILTSTLVD